MSQVVPNTLEVEILNDVLTNALTLRLYSNNFTPSGSMAIGSFTEVTGGGYTSFPLTFANWTITAGDPSTALYNASQTFTFTGPTTGPGTIYGYYVTRNSDNALMWAERFPPANVPFVPIAGSGIRILPAFSAQSQF